MTAVRRALGCSKAGHAGTLDPAASGLLVIALGKATRLLEFLPLEPKRYRFGIRFGAQTDTLDSAGAITREHGPIPSPGDIESVLPKFRATLQQLPPDFSAVKVGGVRAYRIARGGDRPVLQTRPVTIFSLDLEQYDRATGDALLSVTCSGGTYVRSLSRDIAEAAGTFGYASSVRRTGAGAFDVEDALPFDRLDEAAGAVVPINDAVRGLPQCTIDPEQVNKLVLGCDLTAAEIITEERGAETVFAFDPDRELVAVLRKKTDGKYHPAKVFCSV